MADDLEDDSDRPGEDPVLTKAKKRFKIALEFWSNQAERERDDLAFQVPEKQWDENAKRQRLGLTADGIPTPARPCLSVSKIDQPIQMVLNQERAAHLGVSIQPLSADAEEKTAEILEGLYRRIERDSRAHLARSWAFNRATKAGRGYYEIVTEYDPYAESEFPDDQVIRIKRILYQESVYFDPAAQEPDFCDANYAFIATWMPLEVFKAEFPDAQIPGDEDGFEEDDVEDPTWVKGGGNERAVRVLKYYDRVKEFKRVKEGAPKRETCEVKWYVLTSREIVDEGPWQGHYIPLITVVGSELIPFDNERRWQGLIGPAKDGQRGFNYTISAATEAAALEPKAPFVGTDKQFEGYEAEWQQANIRAWPYLRYNADRNASGPPERVQADSSKMMLNLQLSQMFNESIQATTQTYDPALGRSNSKERSGKAIQALQQQGDEGNSHYMHNLAEISMSYEAKVILDLIPAIYDRPERLARTLNEEDATETVMLNARYYKNPENGRPVALQEGQTPPQPRMPSPAVPGPPAGSPMGVPGAGSALPPAPPEVKHYDLKKGIYSVAVSIGKTRQSALQEGAEEIGQMLQAMPNLGPIILPTYLEYRFFPGSKKLAEDLRKVRDRQFPFLAAEDDGAPTPDQLQAKIQAMEQQGQMMQAQLQAAMEAIKTEQAKQQATLQKAAMDNETRRIETEAKVKIAERDNETELLIADLKKSQDEIKLLLTHQHEKEMKATDQTHEATMAAATGPAEPTLGEYTTSMPQPLDVPEELQG